MCAWEWCVGVLKYHVWVERRWERARETTVEMCCQGGGGGGKTSWWCEGGGCVEEKASVDVIDGWWDWKKWRCKKPTGERRNECVWNGVIGEMLKQCWKKRDGGKWEMREKWKIRRVMRDIPKRNIVAEDIRKKQKNRCVLEKVTTHAGRISK